MQWTTTHRHRSAPPACSPESPSRIKPCSQRKNSDYRHALLQHRQQCLRGASTPLIPPHTPRIPRAEPGRSGHPSFLADDAQAFVLLRDAQRLMQQRQIADTVYLGVRFQVSSQSGCLILRSLGRGGLKAHAPADGAGSGQQSLRCGAVFIGVEQRRRADNGHHRHHLAHGVEHRRRQCIHAGHQ